MTRSRKQGKSDGKGLALTGGTNDYGVEFVKIRLSDHDKQILSGWEWDADEFLNELERLVDSGYKVSFSFDTRGMSWLASITGSKSCAHPPNTGKCLVSRGSDFQKAWLSAMYKLATYCEDNNFPGDPVETIEDFG
jgi:hypothetical protein